jgi:glucosylglycerate synthase
MVSTGSSSSGATAEPGAARAEVVIGLTSFNDAATIGAASAGVRDAIAQSFAGQTTKVVLLDAGSTDETVLQVRETFESTGPAIEIAPPLAATPAELPYHGVPARAQALRALLMTARDAGAGACLAFEGNMQAIPPGWVEALAAPVLRDGADFATPCYQRHPVEGALTKGIVYPVFRALFGSRLRQPAASEFACSARLVAQLLDEDFWDAEGASYSADLRLTAAVIVGDAKVTEVTLGRAPHRSRSSADLATTVTQIARTVFDEVEARATIWQRVRSAKPLTQTVGPDGDATVANPAIDVERHIESFRLGYRELKDLWTWILPPKAIVQVGKAALASSDRFRLDDQLWADLVYDFAVGYRLRTLAREHLLRSFVPLYLGWFASFVQDVQDLTTAQVDQRVDRLAAVFEQQKPYLIARWRWPERFRT